MTKSNNELALAIGLSGIALYLLFTQSGQNVAAQIAGAIMNISDSGLNFIAGQEGFDPNPYPDAQGQSIAYGHYLLPGELGNTIIPPLTEAQGLALLHSDAAIAEKAVNDHVTVPLSQNQFDALCDFVYNEGVSHFANSTLLRLLNTWDYQGAADQFAVWDISSGAVNPDLVARRAAEKATFETA